MRSFAPTLIAAVLLGTVLSTPERAAAAPCLPTGFNGLTAALINPPLVTGDVDATDCDIGVYYNTGVGVVKQADVHDALWYGIAVNGDASVVSVDVLDSRIHDIGDKPFNGVQRGVAVYYRAFGSGSASGTVSRNKVYRYQKNGIVANGSSRVDVWNNTVTGLGSVDFIAQNGVQFGFGGAGEVAENSISGNDYTPKSFVACGVLVFEADGVRIRENKYADNERNLCNFGRGGGQEAQP